LAPLLSALTAAPRTATPPFRLAAHVTSTEDGWNLRQVEARIDQSEVRGVAAVPLRRRERPRLSVDLVAPHTVPSDFGWLTSVGQAREGVSSSSADVRLPTAWLRRADGEGNLRVEEIGGLAAGPAGLRLSFKLEQGCLHIGPLRLELGQGAAEGATTIEASDAAPPRFTPRAEANGLQIRPLLAMLGMDEISGTLTPAFVDLRGQGATWREVAAGLDGSVRFRVADESIGLVSLSHTSMGLVETLGVALSGAGGGGATPMTCALGDISVRQGIAHAERLVVVIPQMVIYGEGTVQLSEGMVHLTPIPKPLDGALLRVVVPVVISGDLTSPEVTKAPGMRVGTQSATVPDACG
jgi:hypothetical protein